MLKKILQRTRRRGKTMNQNKCNLCNNNVQYTLDKEMFCLPCGYINEVTQ